MRKARIPLQFCASSVSPKSVECLEVVENMVGSRRLELSDLFRVKEAL